MHVTTPHALSSQRLLDLLTEVRATGANRWLARCPAHDDRSPSLSIREANDGRVLVHCFAGCPICDVLSAVGLNLRDLYPDHHRVVHRRRPTPAGERWVPRDVLRALADECLVVLLACEDIAHGHPMSETNRDRLATAESRIRAAARKIGISV